jgi:hypothetical protein
MENATLTTFLPRAMKNLIGQLRDGIFSIRQLTGAKRTNGHLDNKRSLWK